MERINEIRRAVYEEHLLKVEKFLRLHIALGADIDKLSLVYKFELDEYVTYVRYNGEPFTIENLRRQIDNENESK